jgi:hypothetical protein
MKARRAELHDVFEHAGECVVMAGSNVVRLSRVATYLLRQADDWRTSDQLATALVAQIGEPTEGPAVDLVESALAELAGLGIMQVEA